MPMDAAEAQAFVREVAGMTKDGEQGPDRTEPYVMENDDAVDTLHNLISKARAIAGIPDPDEPECTDENPCPIRRATGSSQNCDH